MAAALQRVLIGISAGIAAYKIPQLVRLLRQRQLEVKVILTPEAKKLVAVDALKIVSGNPVYTDSDQPVHDMDHINLGKWAQLFLICPATANTIAKIAYGIADNLLTTTVLSCTAPLMIAPAMNTAMWQNLATRANCNLLKIRGVNMLAVGCGSLACGDDGEGRLLDLEEIVDHVLNFDLPRCLSGKRVLIASGPTCESIDQVRTITNRSSGRMGAALAATASCMGAEVSVVTGQTAVRLPQNAEVVTVSSSAEMQQVLTARFPTCDICIMAAAVSDFRPKQTVTGKIARTDATTLTLELVPTEDIAASLAQIKKEQFLVCFSLESGMNEERALQKMRKKKCEMMVLNTVADSLGRQNASITLFSPDGQAHRYAAMSKHECSRTILMHIARHLNLYHE